MYTLLDHCGKMLVWALIVCLLWCVWCVRGRVCMFVRACVCVCTFVYMHVHTNMCVCMSVYVIITILWMLHVSLDFSVFRLDYKG